MGTCVTVDRCVRCGGRHECLKLERYDPPSREGATLEARCPTLGQGILFVRKRVFTGEHRFKLMLTQC